jgi:hypothetical protein
MTRNSASSGIGALHPILFFFLIYGISLFLAFVVCRTVYFNINGDATATATEQMQVESTAVALR